MAKKSKFIHRKLFLIVLIIFFLSAFSMESPGQSAERVASLFERFSWRSCGPAVMGGRTVDIEAVEKEPRIIYAACGPGGVWKSENGGTTWFPVFYREATSSVGDLAIAPSDPNIIWVGTGEATCRNSVTIGDGVYKSTDAGRTWKNKGLKETRHISRIIINPENPDIVYVAAMGHLWGPNQERGVFKTTDGGETWQKVLYINEKTGVADLAMDPENPLILYASAYEHRRLPYLYISGGPGSGLYKTTDGGQTWKKLEKELPRGIIGRIGIAVSRSRPEVVYALIEHEEGGLWRSEDRGESWHKVADMTTYRRINTRPFYYSQIRVDPINDQVVYVLSTGAHVSTDGGKTFKAFGFGTHPDHHALWINPDNPKHLILGNDGGIDISYDGGQTWLPVQNIDAAEVYTIGFDFRRPYYVYCGLQDNGTWAGPSQTRDTAGITNDDWVQIGGGDGMSVQIPPDDPLTVYANYQMNNLYRYDWRINRSKNIRPLASLREPPLRFNWLTPIHLSPHNSKTIYVGSQYLLKSTDRGQSWQRISPDLTTNDPRKMLDSGGPISRENTGAEIHCTITTIAESPLFPGLIWVGTDDGLVWITRDGGRNWSNLTKNIPGLPPNTWCSRLEASHFDPGTAYACFDGHRQDDYETYVYLTTDYGQTWKSIRGNLPFGWVNVIREDPKNSRLLYVGTEFGLFASLDRGESWFSLKNNLPTVAVHDIAIHPRDNDLIIGTHGRGIWILDDISFLQEMSPEILDRPVHIFKPRPAVAFYPSSRHESFTSPTFFAKNPPYGLALTIYFKEKPKEKPEISIINSEGETVSQLFLPAQAGITREYWNLQFIPKNRQGERLAPPLTVSLSLPLAPPGEYTVQVKVDGQIYQEKSVIEPDPLINYDGAADKERLEIFADLIALSRRLSQITTVVRQMRRELDDFKRRLKEKKEPLGMEKKIGEFEAKIKDLEKEVTPSLATYSISWEQALRGGPINMLLINLASSLAGYPGPPTQTDREQIKEIEQALSFLVKAANETLVRMAAWNQELKKHGFSPMKIPDKIKD